MQEGVEDGMVDETWLNAEDDSRLAGFTWRAGVARETTGAPVCRVLAGA